MTVSIGQTVLYNAITPARVVSLTNVAGTYNNGPSNNGVNATLTVAASSLTIDSVLVEEGDRVLLQNQTTPAQNGVYICKEISSVVILQRSDDQQTIEQLKAGQFILIGAGTTNAGAAFALVEPIPQVIGVDSFLWVSSPLSGALGTAGSKAASDNALPTLASTAGSGFTAGNFVVSTDALGTLEDAGISPSDIPGITLASAHIYVGNGSNVATDVAMTGDIAITNAGVTSIASGVIVNADVNAAAAIAFSKLAALPSTQVLVGSAGGVATAVAMTGDVTISNTGVTAIGAGKVLLAMLGTGISPAYVVKYAGKDVSGGGSATVVITATGVAASDVVFANIQASANAVTIQKVTPTTNTITVLCSGDPGAATISYQALRAAS